MPHISTRPASRTYPRNGKSHSAPTVRYNYHEGTSVPPPAPPGNADPRNSGATRRFSAMPNNYNSFTQQDIATAAGAEPGVNPRRDSATAQFGHIRQECVIDIADFSIEDVEFTRMGNSEFVPLMKGVVRDEKGSEDLGAPVRVRWINIGGIDWEVMSALALKYNLHALALEDVLQEQGHNHSKADYYREHLFLRILCHSLHGESNVDEDSPSPNSSTGTIDSNGKRAESPFYRQSGLKRRFTGLSGFRREEHHKRMLRIHALTRGDRVNVVNEPMFIFLLRDGTVISIHPTPSLDFTAPITERLHQDDSVLRTSADASLLVQSLLDLIVDRVLEVMDEYQDKIHKLEHDILLKTSMSTVRSLHILSGDLISHKRTLEPIRSVLYALRRYDLDRCIALADGRSDMSGGTPPGALQPQDVVGHGNRGSTGDEGTGERKMHGGQLIEGYLSYKTKVYLADVYDHMDFVLTSLDMFAGISENLINYAFNMASYEMNEDMRRLTLATIIFLPLTLLTGYFGMNFTSFWSINHFSDVFFWILALPIMCVIVPIFTYPDIVKMVRYVRKWMAARKAGKLDDSLGMRN